MRAALLFAILISGTHSLAPNQHALVRSVPNAIHKSINTVAKAVAVRHTHPRIASVSPAKTSQSAIEPQLSAYLRIPLDFEANRGQAPAQFAYVAHGPSYALGVSAEGVSLALRENENADDSTATWEGGKQPARRSDLNLRLIGGSEKASVVGLDQAQGNSNYFIGNDPVKWHTIVPHFNKVMIADAYPGIDVAFYGNQQQLEYDFVVAPGADAGVIQLEVQGAQAVNLDDNGNAVLQTPSGNVELEHPEAYQDMDGVRRRVKSRFAIADGNVLKVYADDYDHRHELVIDPVLLYSVALGGSNGTQGVGLTVDSSGYAYVTGNTCSADFPSTPGAFDTIHTNTALRNCEDGFVVKLDPTASTVVFSDYLGGAGGLSTGTHVATDSTGVYVAGGTRATTFPTMGNIGRSAPSPCSLSRAGANCTNGFILKLTPDGSQLLFSSILGGSQESSAYQVKLNPVTGDLVVVGETNSSDFQPVPTTLETAFGGGSCSGGNPCFNGFVLGLNPTTGAMKYGSFVGGAGNDWSSGLAFDTGGNIYIAGSTQPPMSASLGSVTHTYGPAGGVAAAGTGLFVARLNLSGTTLTPGYLTLVQADADTVATGLAADSANNVYFSGATAGKHLGVTTGAYQGTNNAQDAPDCPWGAVLTPFLPSACGTGLVGKLDATGALSFLTYLGGTAQDMVEAIGLDSNNNIWLTGVTTSLDFPVSADHYTNPGGFSSPFLAEMSNDGTKLPFATLAAGPIGQSTDLFVDKNNNVYITGYSGTVASTPGTYPANPQVFTPALVQKWGPGAAPSISVSTSGPTFIVPIGGVSPPQTITVQNQGTVPMEVGVQMEPGIAGSNVEDFPESSTCGTSLAAGASCTVTVVFQPGPPSPDCVLPNCTPSSRGAAVVINNNAPQGSQTVQLGGTAGTGASISITPNPVVFPAQAAGTASATPLNIQVESAGDSTLYVGSIVLGGANASDFQLSLTGTGGPSCTNPVQPGSFCDFYLAFSPPAGASGNRTATLTFTDSAGDSPQVVQVSGTVASANSLDISPLTLKPTFPVAIGTSTTVVLTLQNPSTSSIQVTGLNLTGTNQADFTPTSSNCSLSAPPLVPFTIAAGASCLVDITVAPSAGASGLRQATLTVSTTPSNSSLPTITLLADAVTNTDPGMSYFVVPNPMNFGGLLVGETSNNASELLTISNYPPIPCAGGTSSCGAPLVITSITPGLSDYAVQAGAGAASCTPFPATIALYSSCTYALVFTPTQAGSRNTTLTIKSNDPQGAVQIPVYGSGLSLPLGEFLQTGLNFGNSAIGVPSPALTTTLQNSGLSNLAISAVTASANFAVSANTCPASLSPGATCTISVTFTPPSSGPFLGTLTITDNGGFSQQQAVNLTGSGASGPQVRIMPPTLNFGNQAQNTLSAAQTVSLTSTGDSALSFPANALRSTPDFIVQSTTCGTSLPPGTSCTVSVQFKPTTITIPEPGTLFITDNAGGSPQPVYMQGTGTQSTAAVTTTTIASSSNPSSFGQSITFTATVSGPTGNTTVPTGSVNFMDGSTSIGSGTLGSGAQAAFSISSLSAGSHSITAVYGGDTNFQGSTSPALAQVVNGASKAATTTTLASSANPSTSGQSVTFTATVVGPTGNTTQPTGSVNFMDGSTSLGSGTLSSSAQATFSTASLSAGTHSVTAVYGGDANFLGSTSVTFTQTVNASTGSFTLSASPTSITVTDGSSGTTTLSVTPTGGFSQQVTFACSGLPAASTCTFSPSTVTPTGSTAATSTLTIATNVAGLRIPVPPQDRKGAASEVALAITLLGLGGLVRSRRKLTRMLSALVFLAALGLALNACGGGSSNTTTTKTPKGSSNITVTGTAGADVQSATVTLVVQ